jgi:hypothetical protein
MSAIRFSLVVSDGHRRARASLLASSTRRPNPSRRPDAGCAGSLSFAPHYPRAHRRYTMSAPQTPRVDDASRCGTQRRPRQRKLERPRHARTFCRRRVLFRARGRPRCEIQKKRVVLVREGSPISVLHPRIKSCRRVALMGNARPFKRGGQAGSFRTCPLAIMVPLPGRRPVDHCPHPEICSVPREGTAVFRGPLLGTVAAVGLGGTWSQVRPPRTASPEAAGRASAAPRGGQLKRASRSHRAPAFPAALSPPPANPGPPDAPAPLRHALFPRISCPARPRAACWSLCSPQRFF